MDAASLIARARPLVARGRAALGRFGCSPAELVALAALASAALALLGVLWLRTPGAAESARTDAGQGVVSTGDGPVSEGAASSGGAPPGGREVLVGASEVVVHVAGAVRAPGVYELAGGARVTDAVEAAGGATQQAVVDHLNLAREVRDGEHLLVPDEASVEASGGGGRRPDGRIDVNRASASELEELPGVGPVTAERIVDHREAHGPFADPRDLMAVPGIGERTLETLADHIGV